MKESIIIGAAHALSFAPIAGVLVIMCMFAFHCTPQPAPTPAQPAVDSGETCEASCARRSAAGCLDVTPELCVETCRRVRDAGLYAPERCRP